MLFGVQQLPAGRSAILAYTMPVWTVLIRHGAAARAAVPAQDRWAALGMLGMVVLLGDDVRNIRARRSAHC